MITLYPHQKTAQHWVNSQLNQGNNPLLVMPTGTGKTKTSTVIVIDRISLGKKLLVLVPQIEIFQQWELDFSENNINYGYINDEGVIGRKKDIYICMYQSLDGLLSRLPEKFCKQFNEIIIDEAHHSNAQSFRNIFNHFNQCLRWGLTATPYRMDNQPLGEFYNKMFEPIKMSEAIKGKYLCKPIIIIPDEYKDYVPDQKNIDSINKSDQREFIQDKKIIGDMVQLYKEVFDGLPIIIPCSSHKHAILTTEMYEKAGWKVDHIHSGLNKVDRKMIVNSVKKGKTNILVTVGVGIEGMDIPGLYGIIWMRFTESLTIFLQFCGRAARIMKGKNNYVMVDPVGNSVMHGRPDIDRKWSLETDYEPGQDSDESLVSRICPVCSVVNSLQNTKCWICEYDFILELDADGNEVDKKVMKLPKMIDGELVFLDGKFNGGNDGHKDNNSILRDGSDNRHSGNNSIGGEQIHSDTTELTKAEKIQLMSKDLTGLRLKNKFREGVKWL